jgi:RsiW-degrading membrane proteinase PrsW (M82 family)
MFSQVNLKDALMELVLMILQAVAPAVALGLFLILTDRYDKEPKRLLLLVFVLGMLVTLPTLIAEMVGQRFNIFSGLTGQLFEAFIIIGLAEEFFKRLVVVKTVFRHPAFNERLDGIIYCGITALGFATLENFMYILSYSAASPDIWISRALLSVPTHMLLGITMGYYLSMAKFCGNPDLCMRYYRMSLVVPALLHGAFDFILMSNIPLLSLLLLPFVGYLWVSGIIKLRRYYKESKAIHNLPL